MSTVEVFAIRLLVAVCSCVLVLVAALPAGAEDLTRLEITESPVLVSRGADLKISGRTEGLPEGRSVSLQRWFARTEKWTSLDSTAPGSRGRVSFLLEAPRFTARYRLKTEDAHSEFVRVAVRPRLELELNKRDVMEGAEVIARGVMRPEVRGRDAVLMWKIDGDWRLIDHLRVGDGHFRVPLDMNRVGRRPIKVKFSGDRHNSRARAIDVVGVHKREPATWYGPGFFGNRTACGRRYSRDLLGVAHRTLPCGTMVSALYKGRSVRLPVVDRGPYGSSNWDLTEEAAQRLGFRGRDVIGVLRQ